MKLALIGFGTVGQGLAEILRDHAERLQNEHDFQPSIVAVATRRRGSLVNAAGLEPSALLAAIRGGTLDNYPDTPGLERGWDVMRIISESGADVMIDVSVSNLQDAQPSLSYFEAALAAGQHIVTANKGPVALAYPALQASAQQAGKQIRFEGTVMAGTPALSLARESLAGVGIRAARGIFNGTTNYMLTQMESGMSYEQALQTAQALGYAEADPTADVDGWDAASKVLILASALFGQTLRMADLDVTGISGITPEMIAQAQAANERWKLIAEVTPTGGSVQPHRVHISDPLAGVSGATNAITFSTDLMGDVTLVGAGAGSQETAFALLADLLAIQRRAT